MASFKKAGQCNLVERGQLWKNVQNGRTGYIVQKSSKGSGKNWTLSIGKKQHNVNEGTLLKFFELVS